MRARGNCRADLPAGGLPFRLRSIKQKEAGVARPPREVKMATRSATVGTRAPHFSLVRTEGPGSEPRQVSLDDYLDRWLVLLFYPRDFSLL